MQTFIKGYSANSKLQYASSMHKKAQSFFCNFETILFSKTSYRFLPSFEGKIGILPNTLFTGTGKLRYKRVIQAGVLQPRTRTDQW